jgi:hypothetical protein
MGKPSAGFLPQFVVMGLCAELLQAAAAKAAAAAGGAGCTA